MISRVWWAIKERFTGRDDAGMTLVELIVAMFIGTLVIGLVAGVFVMILRSQNQVVDSAQTSGEAQVAVAGLTQDIRNSASGGIQVRNSGNTMILHTGGGGDAGDWYCRAWHFIPGAEAGDSGTLHMETKSPSNGFDTVDNSVAEDWLVVARNVLRIDSEPIFALDVTTGSVQVNFTASRTGSPDDLDAVKLSTAINPRPQVITGDGGCF